MKYLPFAVLIAVSALAQSKPVPQQIVAAHKIQKTEVHEEMGCADGYEGPYYLSQSYSWPSDGVYITSGTASAPVYSVCVSKETMASLRAEKK